MARGRIISNAITGDKKVNDLSDDTSRLAFTWLITFADVDGRTNGDPALLRSMLFPRRRDITIEQIEGYIREWHNAGLIIWYEANGDWYIAFPNFAKHQPWLRKDREAESIIPPPPIEQTNSDSSPAEIPQTIPDNSPKMEAVLRQNDGVPPSEWRHDSGLKEKRREEIKREEKRGGEKPALAAAASYFSDNRIIQVIANATGIVAIPPKETERIEQIHNLLDAYGEGEVTRAVKSAYTRWCKAKTKNGRPYSRVNFGWVDWAQDELSGGGEKDKPISQMTDKEYLEYKLRGQEVQSG